MFSDAHVGVFEGTLAVHDDLYLGACHTCVGTNPLTHARSIMPLL